MALGDLMTSRFSQLPLAVSNHVIEGNGSSSDYHEDDAAADVAFQRRDFDTATTSSYTNAAASSAAAPTSMAYLPQTIVLCELRHAAFEASTPTGPSDSGLVSKWRPKDRVSPFLSNSFCSFQILPLIRLFISNHRPKKKKMSIHLDCSSKRWVLCKYLEFSIAIVVFKF